MARVLLTGASGFVGGVVRQRLLALGHEVVTLGRSAPRDARPGTHLPADLGEPATVLRHRVPLRQVELVAHLGGEVLQAADPARDDPVRAFSVNVLGTAHLLAMLPSSVAAFCFTSTLDVYGPPRTCPITEDHPPRPLTYYAASKLAAESLLAAWSARSGIPLAVLRLSHVYGPGDTSGKAVPSFLRACLRGSRPVVRGDGSDVRDYVYVEDVAEAVARALQRRPAGTFNIASGAGTSIRELLAAVSGAAGTAAEAEWLPASRPAVAIVLDVARARAALGWEPKVGLAEGLRRTVAALTSPAQRLA
jgi:nucleoside-diphosphate-sugar epimerase